MTKPKFNEVYKSNWNLIGAMKDHTIYVCSKKQRILDGRNDTVVDSLL